MDPYSLVASSSSSAASIRKCTYDVFLSFQGEDTGKDFVDHLYEAMDEAGIYAFEDDTNLRRGESIAPEVVKAIQESMVVVVVFSKNYANSCWCLEELAMIVECQHQYLKVLPVFYDVEHSDVRSFDEAFQQHEVKFADDMEKVQRWRLALKTVAKLSGRDVHRTTSGHGSEYIKQIVQDILSYTNIYPEENLIGLQLRVQLVKSLLGIGYRMIALLSFVMKFLSTIYGNYCWHRVSSNAASVRKCTYDVFLSFRGEDTRKNFVDHLYAALDKAGIYTFKDDKKLQRGKSIGPELVKAIQESMIAVVVFSKNYANSCWCLEELAMIVECQQHLKVLPVFYDVEPSDVRGQKGSFYEAFQQHEVKFADDMDKVKRWRVALTTVGNLSGWDVHRTASGHEAENIKEIVQTILSYTESYLDKNLIGMESRVKHVKSLLGLRSCDVRMIGIWGMGGIGKTTIARAVYHQISFMFEGCSFVEDIRENGSDKKGLKSLQEKLLSEILMEEHFKVKDCDDGIRQIRRRFGRKKVLVVLDDVDDIVQLEFLAGAHEWFGPGSRVIITTRDEHLLCSTQEKYKPGLLEYAEAVKLFSKYAFKANVPPKAYEKLSVTVVSQTGHLPLALKVLGSHFCGRSLDFWQSSLRVLAKTPNNKINDILKISFIGLSSLEKKIFLDIACFFKGRERSNVTRVLDSFGFEPDSGITVLIERSLLSVSNNGCLQMHDLIQEMGRSIVRECNPNKRVWALEEIKEVMTTIDKAKTVEAIVDRTHYHFSKTPMASCSAEVLESMNKLRLLDVKGKFTSSEPKYFPEDLRWLCWHMYPFQSLKIKKCMCKLVGFEMQSGQMEQLQFDRNVNLLNLKYMDLSFSLSIKRFPDITGIPNLERLNLSFCSDLVEVDKSVLLHERIIHLYMSCCDSLRVLPSCIQMKSLQTLHLNGCSRLKRFPEVTGDMGRLLALNIDGCDSIKELPSSIGLLTGLIILTMGKYSVSSLLYSRRRRRLVPDDSLRILGCAQPSALRVLDLKRNCLVEDEFPSDMHGIWPAMEKLDLSNNNFRRLFTGVSHLSHLKHLNLSFCFKLIEIYELPPLIQVLRADGCYSLHTISDLVNNYKWLFKISFAHCKRLSKDQESSRHLSNLLMKSFVQKCAAVNHQLSFTVPQTTIPSWFSHRWRDKKYALNIPQNQISKIIGFSTCCRFNLRTLDNVAYSGAGHLYHIRIGYMPMQSLQNLCRGFDPESPVITFEFFSDRKMECGMCVIYKDDIKQLTGIESWIPDYMESGWVHPEGVGTEDLQHGRWTKPSFLCDSDELNTIHIRLRGHVMLPDIQNT